MRWRAQAEAEFDAVEVGSAIELTIDFENDTSKPVVRASTPAPAFAHTPQPPPHADS